MGRAASPRERTLVARESTLAYHVPVPTTADDTRLSEWRSEFDAAARRPLKTRFRYAFLHTYKPVLDDAAYRSFDTTAAYRAWCEENLPPWLGYGAAV
jgi:hypothetical protein